MYVSRFRCFGKLVSSFYFSFQPTPFHADVSDIPNNHNVLYTSIQTSQVQKTLIRETTNTSTRYVSEVDKPNVEAVSLDVTDRDTTYKSPHIPSKSGQTVATKRKSIFESVGNPKDDMKTMKPHRKFCLIYFLDSLQLSQIASV